MQTLSSKRLLQNTVVPGLLLAAALAPVKVSAQALPVGDATRGKAFFQIGCAVCHSPVLGPENMVLTKQGPSLVGVVGRPAGSLPYFNYTKAIRESGLTWNPATLYHFLENPMVVLPGTTMPIPVTDPGNRADVIAYLATLTIPQGVTLKYEALPETAGGTDPNDWQRQAPGAQHHFKLADLPKPFETKSAGNGPQVVPAPTNATLAVPPGFAVKLFAKGLRNPRLLRTAPNGDIFIAETDPSRIRVMRTADGADAPTENQIFAEGLHGPFGLSFYPPGDKPEWLYVANNNSVVRIPYRSGDLKARGEPEVIVPKLADTTGGHSTRDVVFSRDGKRMFISVGSSSNVAEEMKKKTPEEIQAWEAENGVGAAWGPEWHRAEILWTDPEGHQPLRAFATGVRNGVGLAVNPQTGDLWVSTNERDGLGDELVPDYVTRVKEGGYYGWPWFYLGNHEDPRHAGERPDLAGKAIVPDVVEASHSASLQMTFYTATSGPAAFPADYRGDAFAALHGSWNRAIRTGYKIIRLEVKNGVPTGQYDDFVTGFVVDNRSVWGRPVGVTVAHDGALLVTEDGNGTMWRVAYEGEKYAKTDHRMSSSPGLVVNR
ncbi:MAG TPA: PQQ-dependent sugar dehydrogenase [Candidatus Acidoferrum sp.]|jgi:glucose/arabinose dehydrogenase/cytochrome c2|nr:PQQ-dependent sugar dehydrogenase [Candidatus Acidoferrum sp.]